MFELFEVPPRRSSAPPRPPAPRAEERTPQEMAQLVRQIADEVIEGILLELYGLEALPLLEEALPPWSVWPFEDEEDDGEGSDDGNDA